MKLCLALAAIAVITLSSAFAWADEEGAPVVVAPPKTERVRLRVGARTAFISDDAIDRFGKKPSIVQFSLEGDYTVWKRGALGVSAGFAYDVGGSGGETRGTNVFLQVHRLTAPIEGRWAFTPWLYSFARVAPGAVAMAANVEDGSSAETLRGPKWVLATDFRAGAAIRLFPHVWLTPEMGYAWTARGDLHADPGRDEADVLGRDARTNLGSLALNGAFFRVSAAVSF